MPRPKGSKNKPKEEFKNKIIGLRYEDLPDVLTPEEVAHWWRCSRAEIMRQIYAKEIPESCYEMVGNRYKMKKYQLAILKGLREPDNSRNLAQVVA